MTSGGVPFRVPGSTRQGKPYGSKKRNPDALKRCFKQVSTHCACAYDTAASWAPLSPPFGFGAALAARLAIYGACPASTMSWDNAMIGGIDARRGRV